MSNKTRLEALMESNNGYLLTADVVAAGVSKTYLSQFVEEHSPERVAHGIYLSKDAWVDDYYILYRTNRRIIFSHESALYLYNMVDREPSQIMVAVPAGYNATHLQRKGIRVFQMKPEMYEFGSVLVRTSMGNEVAAYNRERTICDIIRCHDEVDSQVFQISVKEYMSSREKNLNRLMKYAVLFGIEDKVESICGDAGMIMTSKQLKIKCETSQGAIQSGRRH